MQSQTHSGLRAMSPEALAAQKFAQQYHEPDTRRISRIEALKTAKRAAAALGLKASKIALIDNLFAYSKPADWNDADVTPVVWPSNDLLARKLGVKVSTLKHHLKGLVEAGLIAYSDSPTYQRRGRRDETGKIIEAYGINLSPIAVRYRELLMIANAADADAQARKQYSYRRTILRKEIQSILLSAAQRAVEGPWSHAQARLDTILDEKPRELDDLMNQVSKLEALLDEIQETYEEAFKEQNSTTVVAKFRPLRTTAETPHSESRNNEGTPLPRDTLSDLTASGGLAFEKEPSDADHPVQDQKTSSKTLEDDLKHISLSLLETACPEATEFVPDCFENWNNLRGAAKTLCLAVGINPQVLAEAQEALGPELAAAAVALILQKYGMNLIGKPGAYLRELTKRGRTGELAISRSLFGLANNLEASAEEVSSENLGEDPLSELDISHETPLPFPASGSIKQSPWAEIAREFAPQHNPDLDALAKGFRLAIKSAGLSLGAANIEDYFKSFCKKWRMN